MYLNVYKQAWFGRLFLEAALELLENKVKSPEIIKKTTLNL